VESALQAVDTFGQPRQALLIGDVEHERLSRQLGCGGSDGIRIAVDHQQRVYLPNELSSTGQPHAAAGAGHHSYRRHRFFLHV
jgi:hypothetical protein